MKARALQLAHTPKACARSVRTRVSERKQHQRHGDFEGRADAADKNPSANQDGGVWCQCANQRTDDEQYDAQNEDLSAPIKITKRASGQEQARIDKIVGVDDPLHLADACVQICTDAFNGEIDHRCVDLREQYAE